MKCDVNSKQFRDAMRYVWMPRLIERIQATTDSYSAGQPTSYSNYMTNGSPSNHADISTSKVYHNNESGSDPNFMPEISGASSDSLDAQVSPGSDLTDCYNMHGGSSYTDNSEKRSGLCTDNVSELWGSSKPGMDIQGFEQHNQNGWLGGGDSLENMWNEENIWFLQQQLCDDEV